VTQVAFCTLAIHQPYRRLARQLIADLAGAPFVVLTDEPADFADLAVRAIRHEPTGPMAVDYEGRPESRFGERRGAAAYHDKRFALAAALEEHRTAIFVDADCRAVAPPMPPSFPAGLAVRPAAAETVAAHLDAWGVDRKPAFEVLAAEVFGSVDALVAADWIYESCFAVTADGNEGRFFESWGAAADHLQARHVFSGEGGVIGLAAAAAGWTVDYSALADVAAAVHHEAGGPRLR
jgi:hypothetical protein